jgi:hypothetical protein
MKTMWSLLALSFVVAFPVVAQQPADEVWGNNAEERLAKPVVADENASSDQDIVTDDGAVSADVADAGIPLGDDVD